MKRKKVRRPDLRKRIADIADPAEKMGLELVLKLGAGKALKNVDTLLEEHMDDGKVYISYESLSVESVERYFEQFRERIERGMQGPMLITRKPTFKGRLIGKEHLACPVYMAALAVVGTGINALQLVGEEVRITIMDREDEIPRSHIRNSKGGTAVILDLARILEEAVSRINFFRHMKKDQYPKIILTPKEARKPGTNTLRNRLGMICNATSAKENKNALERLMQKLGDMYIQMVGTDRAVPYAFRAVKYEDMVVKSVHAADDVEHTIALCNLLAKSSLVCAVATCSVLERMRPERLMSFGYTEEWQWDLLARVIGKLAEMVYGSPYLRLADVNRRMITEGPESKENLFVNMGLSFSLRDLFKEQFAATGDGDLSFMYAAEESEWREASTPTLEELSREFGFSFHAIPGILDVFDRINSMDFITKENLPTIAAIWKETYL